MRTGNRVHRLLSSAASTNSTAVKIRATHVFKIYGKNVRTSDVFLKLYDTGTAPDETATPIATFCLLGSSMFSLDLDDVVFGHGLSYRMTTAAADNSTAAVASGDIICMNIIYH